MYTFFFSGQIPSPMLGTITSIANFQRCKCVPLCKLLFVVLSFSRYCSRRLKMFSLLFCVRFSFMYYLCEKYYKPIIVLYSTADCDSWVPKLTLLDL